MKNKSVINNKSVLILVLLFGCQQLSAAPACRDFFSEDVQRRSYIEETGTPSRIRAALQTLTTGAMALQLGTTPLLRGIKMSGFFWERYGAIASSLKAGRGTGDSPWGRMKISDTLDAKYNEHELHIEIQHNVYKKFLSLKRQSILKRIFPSLQIKNVGEDTVLSTDEGPVPLKTELLLLNTTMLDGESFEQTARSLVETLLNDPKNLLGLQEP